MAIVWHFNHTEVIVCVSHLIFNTYIILIGCGDDIYSGKVKAISSQPSTLLGVHIIMRLA